MRQTFPGYYRPTDSEFDELWADAVIVPDANILLNLYRYSPATKDELAGFLDHFRDRLWIPHQFALEYQRRRIDVIVQRIEETVRAQKVFSERITEFRSSRSHLVIDDALLQSLESVLEDLNKNQRELELLLSHDTMFERVTELFSGRVGSPPADEAGLASLHEEGKKRFAKKIPPGYEDAKKKPEHESYGDFIGWRQILDYAKSNSKGVILLTDDRKDDWWLNGKRGRTIGPRPELIREFRLQVSLPFYMYRPDVFVEEAAKRQNRNVDESTLAEMREHSKGELAPEKSIKAEKLDPGNSPDPCPEDVVKGISKIESDGPNNGEALKALAPEKGSSAVPAAELEKEN